MLRWIRDRFSRRRWPAASPFPIPPDDRVPFERSLAETRRWCATPDHLDPRTSLRSHEIMPWIFEPDPEWIVHHVVRQRGYLLEERSRGGPYRDAAPSGDGRLLVHYPGLNLTDGAAEVASAGFFDIWNIPPWDTWVAYGTQPTGPREMSWAHFLICWVPPQLVEDADRGILVNPERCIEWLDDRTLARLRSAGRMP